MKITAIIILILLGVGATYYATRTKEPVSKKHFDNRIDTLEKEVKQLKTEILKLYENTDSIKMSVRILTLNVDTLKKGQQVIYNEVSKPEDNRSFLSKILSLP